MSILDRAARSAMCILFAATLAGFSWSNGEAEQRKSFIAFLQDINNRPGIHFLVPTDNDEKAIGPYLQQYAIILDFDKDMKVPMDNFVAQAIKLGFGPNPSRARSSRWLRHRRISRRPKTPSTRWSR